MLDNTRPKKSEKIKGAVEDLRSNPSCPSEPTKTFVTTKYENSIPKPRVKRN